MWRMNTTHTSRPVQTTLLCMALLFTAGISFAARPLVSEEPRDLGVDRSVSLDAPIGPCIITERRQCRYEQHECQLVSRL
jgi:hypothetical protein